MQLFYNPDIDTSSQSITFSKDESRHIIKVLRKTEGDILHLTNGNGWLFEAQIDAANPKHCVARLTSRSLQPKRPYQLHLAVAPTKLNDRFEWFLEKATEIGVNTITPLLCDHSERKVIKQERYEKILVAAMKQSEQCYLPRLSDLTPFREFITQPNEGALFIAHCDDERERKSLKSLYNVQDSATILIGPEGDFSVKEITMALDAGFIPITLGNTRLRTETAAIVACHSIAFINL